jgi:methionyl-tRNA formyltransferase
MKYIFIGNRKFVLEEMLEKQLHIVAVFVVENTHLANDIKNMNIDYELISSKKQLLRKLDNIDYDVLISNGCPYILPISKMKGGKYINIHPSLLPDLKGIDPVIGAALFNRDAGATCHIMDDAIDGGDIISQVKIPYSDDLDVSLLYQLSFIAEKECFIKALNCKFQPIAKQQDIDDLMYYSRKPEDRHITFSEKNNEIINKIKAFNNKSQGAFFIYNDLEYKVFDIDVLYNIYLVEYASSFNEFEIMFCYEDNLIFLKDGQLLKLKQVVGDLSKIRVNTYLK